MKKKEGKTWNNVFKREKCGRSYLKTRMWNKFNNSPVFFPLEPEPTLQPFRSHKNSSVKLHLFHSTHQMHIRWISKPYPMPLRRLKIEKKSAYAYSINRSLVSHRIRNKASVFTAELMTIFSCLSHLTLLSPHGRFLLLTDSLSLLPVKPLL